MKNINHLRMASFCCLAWTLNVADLLGVEPSAYKFGFEEAESFSMGSIDGQRGWSLDQGAVEILPAEGTDGSAGLALLGTELFGQASLIIPRPTLVDSNDGQSGQAPHLTFIDMWVRMPAAEWSSFEETLDIDSARVGRFRDSLYPSLAHWHVFNGDGNGGGSWINTGQTVDLISAEAETSPWTRLTIEQDIDHQDSDGLSAFDEFSLGTDPTNKDLIRRDVSAGASLFSRFAGTSARRARVPSP
jgi:hypothetical protein